MKDDDINAAHERARQRAAEAYAPLREPLPAPSVLMATDATLRDYFAVNALVGLLAGGEFASDRPLGMSGVSYVIADAMLEARAK